MQSAIGIKAILLLLLVKKQYWYNFAPDALNQKKKMVLELKCSKPVLSMTDYFNYQREPTLKIAK